MPFLTLTRNAQKHLKDTVGIMHTTTPAYANVLTALITTNEEVIFLRMLQI